MTNNREMEEILDNETGEKKEEEIYFETQRFFATDAETGEPEIHEITRRKRSKCFVEQQQENRSRKFRTRRKPIHGFYIKNQVRSNVIKEVIIFKKKNVGPIVFMLPTLLICPAWASILCLLGEACMHIWSHKRNRRKKNEEIEYRSPLHLISSQFCIHCRSQKLRQKISEIQDKRTLRRRVIYPNFLRRVVH